MSIVRRSLIGLFAAATLAVVSATAAQAGAIRSNSGFYTNTLPATDDGYTGFVSFGFSIDFFGNGFSGGYVNNNGNVTLDSPQSTYTPYPISTTNRQIFAPFFADVDTRTGSPVTYGTDTVGGHAAFAANYVDVCYYSTHCDKTNSFQLVIIDRSDIAAGDFDFEFNIDKVQWETGDASNGSGGLGGNSARVGWSNGSANTFELAGSAVNGAFLDTGPAGTSLIQNDLNSFASVGGTTLGRYFFQVRNGTVLAQVPEPASIALLGLGVFAAGFARKRAKKA